MRDRPRGRARARPAPAGMRRDQGGAVQRGRRRHPGPTPELSTTVRLTRAEFEDMIRPSLDQTIELVRRTLDRAGVPPRTSRGSCSSAVRRGSRGWPSSCRRSSACRRASMPTPSSSSRGCSPLGGIPCRRVVERPAGGGDPRRQRLAWPRGGRSAGGQADRGGSFWRTAGGGEEAAGTGTDPTTAPATSAPATTAPTSTRERTECPTFTIGQRVDSRVPGRPGWRRYPRLRRRRAVADRDRRSTTRPPQWFR